MTVTSQVVLDGKITDGDFTKLPMAAKCGVQGIPFVVLVGKDGNVDSIHVRGPKLRSRLTELLGDAVDDGDPGRSDAAGGEEAIASDRRAGR